MHPVNQPAGEDQKLKRQTGRTICFFSIVKGEHDDPMDDLDVNMAIWGIFLNATLRAAAHLGQDHEANLRFVKNNLWNRKGQLFREAGKLISDQNEITGKWTTDFQDATWMSTSFFVRKGLSDHQHQNLSSPTLCSVWEKGEMILLNPGRGKFNGIRKTTTSKR